jgi:hypothetical protein
MQQVGGAATVAALVGALGGVAALAVACATPPAQTAARAPDDAIVIDAAPVPLNPQDASARAIGDFAYAGGLALTSRQTGQLHGLSDLEVTGTDRLTAVGDLGVILTARLVLDGAGRLVGITDAHLAPLTGEDGRPLLDKTDADAEGLALLANGDRLVSFERRDRIWLYPAKGGPPHPVPSPEATFPVNGGMEALGSDPDAGADAYVVGGEVSGDTWSCRVSVKSCTKSRTVSKPNEFGLSAMKRLPGMRTAYVLRAFDVTRGNRISLQIFRGESLIARMELARPATVDNFEGLAAVPRANGGFRFYLLSDDNASASQRTLLLAFDWQSH